MQKNQTKTPFLLSTAGLALLIAKGNKAPSSMANSSINGEKIMTQVTSPEVKFSAVKTSENSDIELDTSEAEPEVNL